MAWTTQGAFDVFYGEINLPGDHHAVANTRRDWVLQRLRCCRNGIRSGSIPSRMCAPRPSCGGDPT
jgi:hypothetical protein